MVSNSCFTVFVWIYSIYLEVTITVLFIVFYRGFGKNSINTSRCWTRMTDPMYSNAFVSNVWMHGFDHKKDQQRACEFIYVID